jgi:hypothetical protein
MFPLRDPEAGEALLRVAKILIGIDTGDLLTRKAPWHHVLSHGPFGSNRSPDCGFRSRRASLRYQASQDRSGNRNKRDNAAASKVQAVALAQARPSIFETPVELPLRRTSSYLAGRASVMGGLAAAVARPFVGSAAAYTHATDGRSARSVPTSFDPLTVVKVLPAQRAFTAKINAGRGDPRLAQRNA